MGDRDRTVLCRQCQSRISDDSRFCSRCGHFVEDKADTLTYTPPLEKIFDDHLVFAPGDKFGPRYRIIEEIGRGGMGRVYKAEDQELNIIVALKMIRSAFSKNPRFIQRFKEETLLARSISHENVIRIHDLGDVDDIKFISMDYIKGHDLKELIQTSGTLSVETAISITRQLCKGLHVAHQKNIIHLDLKPRNIMLDSEGKVYIMDFGVARSMGSPETAKEKKIIGTPAYISPEQAKGEHVDQTSDIYSLGIILFEMLVGKRPFEADSLDDMMDMQIHKKPLSPSEIRPQIPPFLDDIVLRCLQKDMNKRYQNVADLLNDLEAHKEESQTYIPPPQPKSWKFLYLIGVVLLAALAVYLWLSQKGSKVSVLPEEERIPLVVMYFENNTGDENLDHWRKALPSLIIRDLLPSKFIRVLSADRLYSVLESLDLQEKKSYSSEDFNKVTLRGGANHLLYGYYTLAEDTFRIDVMLQNIREGELLGSTRIEGKGDFAFYDAADQLSPWIKQTLHITRTKIALDSDSDIRDIFTTSPDALKLYIQGKQSYYLGNFQESNELLEKAVEVDQEFALAYRQLSENYHYLGKVDQARKFATIALSMKDNVSIWDRYLLEGWAYTILDESLTNAKNSYLEMLKNYPDDEDANVYLGAIYRNVEEWDLAQERFEKILSINPILAIDNILLCYRAMGQYEKSLDFVEANKDNFLAISYYHLNRGIFYFYQKNYNKSQQELEKAMSFNPDFLAAKELLGHLHLIQDDFDKAEDYYQNLITSDHQTARSFGQLWLVSMRLAQGRYGDCKMEIMKEIREAEKDQRESDKLEFLNLLAYVNLRMGLLEEAHTTAEKAVKIATEYNLYFEKIIAMRLQGFILLRMNNIEEAKKAASQLKSYVDRINIPKFMRYSLHLEGMIAQHENRDSMAIEYFARAISLLSSQYESLNDHAFLYNSLAMAYYKTNDLDQAQKQLETIIGLTTGRLQWGDIYAKSFYWLGKIHQNAGRKQEAVKNYEKFLSLWKDADSQIEEIQDAQELIRQLEENGTDRQSH